MIGQNGLDKNFWTKTRTKKNWTESRSTVEIEALKRVDLEKSPREIEASVELPLQTKKTTAIRRTAVRETSVSRHHGVQLRDPLKALEPSQPYPIEVLK